MTRPVRLQPAALRDLMEAHNYAYRAEPVAADRWLMRFQAAIQTLEHNPERCVIAPEGRRCGRAVREFLFGKRPNNYRVLYIADAHAVMILRIRRAQRRNLTADELQSDES